jgi:alkenylglycerophosphocholine/alkenylglycerophosphoethanolamine hydrolase
LGDLFLEFERLNHVRLYFELGIAAFLLGHVIYVWAFLVAEHKFVRSGAKNIVRTLAPVWLVAVAVFGAILRFGHIEAALVAPVFVYAMTIMTMLGVALVLKDQWVTFGALLFVCSDLLLAVDRFVVPVPQSTFLIMTTYYGAQFFIATSFA